MANSERIEGLEQIFKALRGLEPKLKLKAIKNSTKASALVFKNKMKANAPKLTGALKRGFAIRQMTVDTKNIIGSLVYVRTKGHKGKDGRTKGQIKKGDDPFYWRFQEFGFNNVAGKHFIKAAYDSHKKQSVKTIEKKIADEVNKYRGS